MKPVLIIKNASFYRLILPIVPFGFIGSLAMAIIFDLKLPVDILLGLAIGIFVSELVYAFDKIRSCVVGPGGIEISATKNCVVFFETQTFLVIKSMRKLLNIKFYLQEPIINYKLLLSKHLSETIYSFIKQSQESFNSHK